MRRSRQLLLFVVVASIGAPAFWARSAPPAQAESGAALAPDLSILRVRIDESNAAREAGDNETAGEIAAEVVETLLARPLAEQDAAWLALLESAGDAAFDAQDAYAANRAWNRVYELRSATLPDDHPDLQALRGNLAGTLYTQGDLAGAQVLLEKVLEVYSRTLPDDHADLQRAHVNLALIIKLQGDFEGARLLEERALESLSRTLPDDHPELQRVRQNLATTLYEQGDFAGARALEERVLEVLSRTLPDDHPELQTARSSNALTLKAQGDLAGARALQERVLEVLSRMLPDDDPDLQMARANLAVTTRELGDLAGARALEELVLEVFSRTLPGDDPSVVFAQQNLAATLAAQGQLAGARALEENVLEVLSRLLPDDHPDLQDARSNLAATIHAQGDLAGARTLFEKVLEVRSRTLSEDHPDLQNARLALAAALESAGDLAGARALEESVLETFSRTLPDDHPDLQSARQNLAGTIHQQGDLAGARALIEKVLEVRTRTLPDDHPDLQNARSNLAATIQQQGDLASARALQEKVLEVSTRTLPDDHPELQATRRNLAVTIANEVARERSSSGRGGASPREREGGRTRCAELIDAMGRAQMHAARATILGSPGREAEERCANMADELDVCLSFAQGYGMSEPLRELEPRVFELAETMRGAALTAAELTRRAAHSPRYGERREALRAASDELARLAQKGTTSEEFDRARAKRESAERELVALARELPDAPGSDVEFKVESLSGELTAGKAAVAFLRYRKSRLDVVDELDSTGEPALRETSTDNILAFVLQSSTVAPPQDVAPESLLTLVDLGPIEPIEAAARGWREGLGVADDIRGFASSEGERASPSDLNARGDLLRRLVFDPLLAALAGALHVVVVPDDVLHLVPIDALPIDEGALVGDRWRIETRASLTELLVSREPFGEPGRLVAFGDVDYSREELPDDRRLPSRSDSTLLADADIDVGSSPARLDARAVDTTAGHPPVLGTAGILRGSAWSQGFSTLSGTGVEVRGIVSCFADQFGDDAAPEVCDRAKASRARLLDLAPTARFLHIATHGWFAPESIRSWSDPEPLDKLSGLGMRRTGAEQVRGMSPMLLCGLALAGANSPEDELGRAPGLVTADELSTLDLSDCELAVLSACDTNVGERRAGQGVASLQKALQMAGARSVITSLWKVPDEATKELMLDFYRRLWVEQKPKHQALWEAKKRLREAKDEHGEPKYTVRDWAAWVLTGIPD